MDYESLRDDQPEGDGAHNVYIPFARKREELTVPVTEPRNDSPQTPQSVSQVTESAPDDVSVTSSSTKPIRTGALSLFLLWNGLYVALFIIIFILATVAYLISESLATTLANVLSFLIMASPFSLIASIIVCIRKRKKSAKSIASK